MSTGAPRSGGGITWVKVVLVVVLLASGKYFYDELASEGNPFTTLMFKVRAPYLNPEYLNRVRPTSFIMQDAEYDRSVDAGGETFSVSVKTSYPQVEYYGEVLSRSALNQILIRDFEAVESEIWTAFKTDAERKLSDGRLRPGFGNQPATLHIIGEVAYFSKSIVSVKYRISWGYAGSKELFPVKRRSGIAIDIESGRSLALKDVLSYPFEEFIGRLWDSAKYDLDDRQLPTDRFKLYHDTPDFYVSPVGLVLVNLSDDAELGDVEIRIPFRENVGLFRADGPLSNIASPTSR